MNRIIKLMAFILFGIVLLYLLYVEIFVCGGFEGTISDIPRYCWWLK